MDIDFQQGRICRPYCPPQPPPGAVDYVNVLTRGESLDCNRMPRLRTSQRKDASRSGRCHKFGIAEEDRIGHVRRRCLVVAQAVAQLREDSGAVASGHPALGKLFPAEFGKAPQQLFLR